MNPRFKKQLALNAWLPLAAAAALLLQGGKALAVEGMWTPDQLPEIEGRMRQLGLELPAGALSDLTGFPFGAVISLGGCSASFVSPEGLVVTNHHCARGSVQYNSTPEHNYLADGFVAATREGELRAAPGTRVYVTTKLTDVTGPVTGGLPADMPPRERYQAMDDRKKRLVADCEAPGGLRCVVASFHGGARYRLVERLEIRDVRLVYAPGDNIGKYGGDVDNWMWPRHTGDFSFYRAYVGPDGRPADYSKDNVPFRPKHFLKVSRAGLKEGDFIMVAGYPGSTNRYARLSEVEHTFGWTYPTLETLLRDWIATIEAAAPEGSDARIKYEARLSGLNNYMKNLGGQIEGARRVGLAERRQQREAALLDWVATRHGRTYYRRLHQPARGGDCRQEPGRPATLLVQLRPAAPVAGGRPRAVPAVPGTAEAGCRARARLPGPRPALHPRAHGGDRAALRPGGRPRRVAAVPAALPVAACRPAGGGARRGAGPARAVRRGRYRGARRRGDAAGVDGQGPRRVRVQQ